MCGRFGQVFDLRSIEEDFHQPMHFSVDVSPRYNIAPSQSVLCGIPHANQIRFGHMFWGVEPSWTKRRIINAKWEKVRYGNGYWSQWRRCIVPSSGFYEWARVAEQKQAYHIHPTASGLIYFGGLWSWVAKERPVLVIVTTASETWMQNVHHRQPIILDASGALSWLKGADPDIKSPQGMNLSEVGAYVNKVSNEGPQCWIGK